MRNFGKVKIFYEIDLRSFLESKLNRALDMIENEQEDYILNVNVDEFIEHISSFAFVEPLCVNYDNVEVSRSEALVPAELFPENYYVKPGKNYKKDIMKFHIPFSGDRDLFRCRPSTYTLWTMDLEISKDEVIIEIINFDDDAMKIKRDFNSTLGNIKNQVMHVIEDIENYNKSISARVSEAFLKQKDKFLKQANVMSSLGVPIRKSKKVSETFSIPTPKLRKPINVSPRPSINEPAGYKPEPTLEESTYFEILKLIHDLGQNFERLPSVYADKYEEHLRDHFLMILEPHFKGSATGETFNKSGKTDILLRHEGKNVFIAECKFWHGKNAFLDTISQLLRYLTWRDSKAAIIIFVQNKELSPVISNVKIVIEEHPNYICTGDDKDETWLNYKFHLNDDKDREVCLAVMLYHTPL